MVFPLSKRSSVCPSTLSLSLSHKQARRGGTSYKPSTPSYLLFIYFIFIIFIYIFNIPTTQHPHNTHLLFLPSNQPTKAPSLRLQTDMCPDDWVKVAMADDSLVVDLLLRLHQPPPPPPYPLQLQWTVRQRRSKSVPRHALPNTKAEPTRASPTTPLSWSGATSASGGSGPLDGYEESSRPTITKHVLTSRSKVANPSETAIAKKSRRKKTLAELKEEESLLLKERRSLKNELASLRLTVEKHRATNENLKKLKLDLESRRNPRTAGTSEASEKAVLDLPQSVEAQFRPSNSVSPEAVKHKVFDGNLPVLPSNSSSQALEMGNQASTFVLPDLNMPVEEDLNSNSIH